MQLQFEININATAHQVWEKLWNTTSYTIWTSIFSHGSYANYDWKINGAYQFLSTAGDGIYGTIANLIPNEFVSFIHVGQIKNYINEPVNSEVEKWSGKLENYRLQANENTTTLTVTLETIDEFAAYMQEHFPKALQKVKELCEKNYVCIETTIDAPVEKCWQTFTNPTDVQQWNFAADSWHCPKASNQFAEGGEFSYTMAAKDDSFSFDLYGTFDKIINHQYIQYNLAGVRNVEIYFIVENNVTRVIQSFEPETENPIDTQEQGWQLILNNFKNYIDNK